MERIEEQETSEMSDEKKEEKPPTWKEFSDITTFHGIRYIPSNMRVRGICWFIVVIAVLVLFIYQVATRTRDYLRYDSTMTIEKNYRPLLPFPRVTFCNQNSFRLTAITERGMYEFLSAVYNKSDEAELMNMAEELKLKGKEATEFMERMSHQKEDMFETCAWDGIDCDIDDDFEPIMTDMGLCYTFNPKNQSLAHHRRRRNYMMATKSLDKDDERMKRVEHAGQEQGLKMLLNIEHYEHLGSAQSDNGIKILLHSPAEFPRVKGLGFSVAPGTQTLVVINREKVSSLPPPWGKCNTSDENPVSICEAQCRENQVRQACDCIDPNVQGLNCSKYDPVINNTRNNEGLCDLSSTLICIPRSLDRMKLDQDSCNCSIPCEQDLYEPSMSYGSLSDKAIKHLTDTNSTNRKLLFHKYRTALQTEQRFEAGVDESDVILLGRLDDLLESYSSALDIVKETFASREFFRNKSSDKVNFPEHMNDFMEEDSALLIELRKQTFKELDVVLAKNDIFTWYKNLEDLFTETGGKRRIRRSLADAIQACKKKNSELAIEECDNVNVRPEKYFQKKVAGAAKLYPECKMFEQRFNAYIRMFELINQKENIGKLKDKMISGVSFRTRRSEVIGTECLDFLTQLKTRTTKACKNLELLAGYEKARVADIVEQIQNLASEISNKWTTNYIQSNVASCERRRDSDKLNKNRDDWRDWKDSLGPNPEDEILAVIYRIQKHYEEMVEELKQVRSKLRTPDSRKELAEHFEDKHQQMMNILNNLEIELKDRVREYVRDVVEAGAKQLTDMYRDGITKDVYMLSIKADEEASNRPTDEIFNRHGRIRSKRETNTSMIIKTEILSQIGNVTKRIVVSYGPEAPKFNSSDFRKLKLVKLARTHRKADGKFKNQLSKLKTNPEEALTELVGVMSQEYQDVVKSLSSPLVGISSDLSGTMEELHNALSKVKEKIVAVLDDKFFKTNFLQVEIYYKELSYMMRRQQRAFEFLSLLSEIGGFMGLLLGASVLTLFELIDFLILSAYIRCSQKKKGNDHKENNLKWIDDDEEPANKSKITRGQPRTGSRILR